MREFLEKKIDRLAALSIVIPVSEIVDTIKLSIAEMPFVLKCHLMVRDAQFFDRDAPIEIYIRRDKFGLYCENPFNHIVRHTFTQTEVNGKIEYNFET